MMTSIVIFGASGDLTGRKLIPALFRNALKKRLSEPFQIIGVSRSRFSDDEVRSAMRKWLAEEQGFSPDAWERFASRLSYIAGDIGDPSLYESIARRISGTPIAPANALFYLAIAPDLYAPVARSLHAAGLLNESDSRGTRRMVIEKPFGRDGVTAAALNRELHAIAQEHQIFRIDHYLGKETVQNILVFRFGNAIFEPLWNRNYIDHVQISVAETVGIEHRAGYYEHAGALRDMFQNHLLQLLTLVAMESPIVFDAHALRNEKAKVLRALRTIAPEQSARFTVRGQYDGYVAERGVATGSQVETFAAVKCFVDNWRWQGVPFYLRSGKRLATKSSEIIVQFRRPPMQILDIASGQTELFTNRLSMCIQPDEGIRLRFLAKVPDRGMETRAVDMDFRLRESFGEHAIPEAYERLLMDALQGDASLFARSDEIELSWQFIDSIREGWNSDQAAPLLSYSGGSWGPPEAEELLGRDGRWWVHDC